MADEVRRLIETVNELSEQMASVREQQRSNTNSEVSRVFRRTTSSQNTMPVTVNSIPQARPAVSASTSTSFVNPSSSTRFRRLTQMRKIGNNVVRKTRTRMPNESPFLCDLVLLPGPSSNVVPRQGSKLFLMEHGHVLSACQFTKGMSEIQVETTILQAFVDKIPSHVDIEILTSAHSKLVKPALAPGQQGISGLILHRIFKNKPVYVRPSHQLIQGDEEITDEDNGSDQEVPMKEVHGLPMQVGEAPSEPSQPIQPVRPVSAAQSNADEGMLPMHVGEASSEASQPIQSMRPVSNSSQAEVEVSDGVGSDEGAIDIDDMYSSIPSSPVDDDMSRALAASVIPEKQIAVHRNNVLKDMISEFKDATVLMCSLEIVFINNRGDIEDGRGSGVMREALSTFWREFFSALSSGASEKVPSIRHDYQKEEWQSIARILVVGFQRQRYFPLSLSQAFIAPCLFGEEALPPKMLLESFFEYISKDERETLIQSTSDECDPSTDDEVLEVLSTYKCKSRVTKENMSKIIDELAHQEIIQHPKYIASAWAPIVCSLKAYAEFKCTSSLKRLYELKRPTPKTVVKLFNAKLATDNERECFSHFKRFVKTLDDSMLGVLLQFITGSNVITVDKIEVEFTDEGGAARRPIAHTCAPLLKLPSTYTSYNELSEEFSCVLRETSSWAFNII